MPANSSIALTGLETPGARIRFLRRSQDLTQETLARMALTTQPTVARWERDEFLPHKASKKLLADALGVAPEFLFGERWAS